MSKFSFYKSNDFFDIWKYEPDIFHAFPMRMEPISVSWRVRCIIEYFVGYEVYYIKDKEKKDSWMGYCVISNGRNPRYKFATKDDIIFGRYFIENKYRGKGIAKKMLIAILNDCNLQYKNAFAYLNKSNVVSFNAISGIGGIEVDRFNLKGLFRRVVHNQDGDYILMKYIYKEKKNEDCSSSTT